MLWTFNPENTDQYRTEALHQKLGEIMRCRRHQRTNCDQCNDQTSSDNVGQISIDPTSGDVNVGIGGGLTIDTQTGDLGVQIAPGLSIDF